MIRTLVLILLIGTTAVASESAPERLPLWETQAPIGDGKTEEAPSDASLTIHHAIKGNGAAMVICPGGGYGGLAIGPEGHGIAEWLNRHGITGVVLEYRLPRGRPQVPLLDAQRAICLIRSRATDLGVDPARIGIIGFSAGGHLAASAATLFTAPQAGATDPVMRLSNRPDFAILVYPVISMQDGLTERGTRGNLLGQQPSEELIRHFSIELQVTDNTPPAYLAHAKDDGMVVIGNSRAFAAAMRAKHRPVALLELPSGGHGLNGYQGPSWDAWQTGSLQWLADRKIIPVIDAGNRASR